MCSLKQNDIFTEHQREIAEENCGTYIKVEQPDMDDDDSPRTPYERMMKKQRFIDRLCGKPMFKN